MHMFDIHQEFVPLLRIFKFFNDFFLLFFDRATGQTYRNGTCLTNAECNERGGSASGTCAGG